MRKHIQKAHAHVKTLHKHLKKPAQSHHYIAFMIIIAGFAILSVAAFATYAADEQLCDATMTDCTSSPVIDETAVPVVDYTDELYGKAIVKLKINTLPVYQKLYGKNSKEVRGLKKLITSLTKLRNQKIAVDQSSERFTKKDISPSVVQGKNSKQELTLSPKKPVKSLVKKVKPDTLMQDKTTEEIVSEPIKEPVQESTELESVPPFPTSRKAMTWVARERAKEGIINVGNDSQTNAYQGDTDVNTLLPMLCMHKQDLEMPAVLAQEYELRLQNNDRYDDAFYNGWIGGYAQITTPIVGSMITSRDVANKICVNQLGGGWEFAEFHSPQGGRGRFAFGDIPAGQRFWVGINDQPANPWGPGW